MSTWCRSVTKTFNTWTELLSIFKQQLNWKKKKTFQTSKQRSGKRNTFSTFRPMLTESIQQCYPAYRFTQTRFKWKITDLRNSLFISFDSQRWPKAITRKSSLCDQALDRGWWRKKKHSNTRMTRDILLTYTVYPVANIVLDTTSFHLIWSD